MATAEQFRSELNALLNEARSHGLPHVDVNAGELHRRVGGYPGPQHNMPTCCSVMRALARTCKHEVLDEPQKGKGPRLTIRYYLDSERSKPETTRCVANEPEQVPRAEGLAAPSLPACQRQCEIRMLVIGSCTGEKNVRDCPCLLTAAGLAQNVWHERLKPWELPAAELYAGPQHIKMMRGVRILRQQFGETACVVNIISAGYGLVSERQMLVPYEVTFSGRKPREIARIADTLKIPCRLQSAVTGFPLVVFLLGKEYLYSTLPLRPDSGQRRLYFTSEDAAELVTKRDTTVILAGKPEASKYGSSTLSLKGRMFQLLTNGLVKQPEMWKSLLEDTTPAAATCLMESALEPHR